ncbi:MAG TPA: LptA/OstA family protein [Methylovirgula sp.]|nr:LptA/OstA family protein [Methylovirgula sp.]
MTEKIRTPASGLALIFLCGMLWLVPAGGHAKSGPNSDNSKPINISAAKLDYYDKQRKLIYSGNVVAVQGDMTIRTPFLVIYLYPKQSGPHSGPPSTTGQMRRMEASGPVTLISKDQVATGDSGIYEKPGNKVYLNGNVSLTQGPDVTKGDHIVYDMNTHQAVVTGHVRSMFVPDQGPDAASPKSSNNEAGTAKAEQNIQ